LDGIAEEAISESAKILGETLNGKDIDNIFYLIADIAESILNVLSINFRRLDEKWERYI
jgi:hypothetical protein